MRKRKYSAELIISIVKERIEKETSWKGLGAKYNIQCRRIEGWVIHIRKMTDHLIFGIIFVVNAMDVA